MTTRYAPHTVARTGKEGSFTMGKGLLLWLLGVPGGIVILLLVFGFLR
jgi:hypothetical protein